MKKISYKIFLVLFFFTAIILQTDLYSQVTQEWVRSFNSGANNDDYISGMAVDKDGNVIIIGRIQTPIENSNYCTVKYNSQGVQQWVQIYNGPGMNSIDDPTGVAVDKQGNVYVTGLSEATGFLTDDYCTIKYSPQGVQEWVRRYNGPANSVDDANAIVVDNSGNIYVTGGSIGTNNNGNIITIKYKLNGDTVWSAYYNGNGNAEDVPYSIACDKNNNIYITGFSVGGNPAFRRGFALSYDSAGAFRWINYIPGSSISLTRKIYVDTTYGDVYICGNYTPQNGNFYLVAKYNNNGQEQWVKWYSYFPGGISDLVVDQMKNIYVTGIGYFIFSDYCTVKFNSNGDTVWSRKYNNNNANNYDEASSMAIDKYSNIYVTGNSYNGTAYDFVTIKYNSGGVQQWLKTYPGGGSLIYVNQQLNVYVSGSNNAFQPTGIDFVTIKYSQVDGINPVSGRIPEQFKLYQNYPNPFNNSTIIRFDLKQNANVTLKIYDALGREINTLVNSMLQAGEYSIPWVAAKESSGLYFCNIIVRPSGKVKEFYIETKKIVLNK
jgi:hypothetical protein